MDLVPTWTTSRRPTRNRDSRYGERHTTYSSATDALRLYLFAKFFMLWQQQWPNSQSGHIFSAFAARNTRHGSSTLLWLLSWHSPQHIFSSCFSNAAQSISCGPSLATAKAHAYAVQYLQMLLVSDLYRSPRVETICIYSFRIMLRRKLTRLLMRRCACCNVRNHWLVFWNPSHLLR